MNENSKPKSIIGFTTRFIVITIAITLALSLFFSKGNLGALFNGLGQLASTYSHPHAPNLDLVIKAPLQVKIHLCAVLMAIGLGIFQLAGLKGSRLHRFFGWSWVIFMLTAALWVFDMDLICRTNDRLLCAPPQCRSPFEICARAFSRWVTRRGGLCLIARSFNVAVVFWVRLSQANRANTCL